MNDQIRQISDTEWEIPQEFVPGMRVPGTFFLSHRLAEGLEEGALTQLANVATLPGILRCSLGMPDIHWGYGFPIGGVAAFDEDEGIISPGGVGFDINCGVRMITTPLTVSDIPDMKELVEDLFAAVPTGVGSKSPVRLSQNDISDILTDGAANAVDMGYGVEDDVRRCEENGAMAGAELEFVSKKARARGIPQCGTLGSGNHFLEVQAIDEIADPKTAEIFGVREGQICVMIHCGSRGLGHQVCTDHLKVLEEAVKKYNISLVDTKKDRFRKVESHGITMEICETALSADFIINLPVLKGHCQTLMTHAMKNLKGFLSDRSKRDFHRYGLMRPIAAINDVVKPGLTISDSLCGDLDFEEGGNPVQMDRMMASTDPILLDAYSASLMGFSVDDIGYLKVAKEWGIGDTDASHAEIIELNKPVVAPSKPKGQAQRLSRYTDADEACSACFASLIHALKRLDEEGSLHLLDKKVSIGQGYRGRNPEIGVGSCCSGAAHTVKGCPPKADDILDMLHDYIS